MATKFYDYETAQQGATKLEALNPKTFRFINHPLAGIIGYSTIDPRKLLIPDGWYLNWFIDGEKREFELTNKNLTGEIYDAFRIYET